MLSDKAITDVKQPNVFDCFEMFKYLALMLGQNGTAKQVNFGEKVLDKIKYSNHVNMKIKISNKCMAFARQSIARSRIGHPSSNR